MKTRVITADIQRGYLGEIKPMKNFYLSTPVISLYDGDGDPGDPNAVMDPPDPTPPNNDPPKPNNDDPNTPVGGDPNARFDQEQVNKIVQDRLAKERKKQQEQFKQLERSYQDVLATQTLDQEQREALEQQLEDLRRQHRTKEEQAKHEKKQLQEQYQQELKDWQDRAVKWENEYKSFVVEKSLMDAAVSHDAFLPQQIQDVLIKHTKLVEATDESGQATGKLVPMVDLPDVDADTGKPIITQRTPQEAVERLKELQPNLFKSNVVSGVGGNSSTGGVQPGADGNIDMKQLTPEQFMKLYKEDPSKLGLKGRRRY